MPFAAALSEHPLPTHAAGEVIGTVLEALGEGPELAMTFVTAAHAGALEDIAGAVREVLRPGTLLGVNATSVLGGAREVEERAAVVLWAGRFGAPVTPVRLEAVPTPADTVIAGIPADAGGRVMLVLADPFGFPVDTFLDRAAAPGGFTVVGGLASGAVGPGGNQLLLDRSVHHDGAVGALLPPGVRVTPIVSQGCRPIGDPMIVTRSERNVIFELAGQPALVRLADLVNALSPEDRALAQRGIHIGRVINEGKLDFEAGDFLIRNVVGGDRSVGALAVGDLVEVGSTVQFQVRDAGSADADLRALLGGHGGDGALVFTCNGRGVHLFGQPDHDAKLVESVVPGGAVAGMFCNGELGPIGDRSFLHGFTASVLLFNDP